MAAAISAACVSSAKCPVSKKRTTAPGMSRLNASAPGGRKNGSFLPHSRQEGRLMGAEILLEGRIERDVALVVAEQVELHLGHAGPGEVEIVERVAVRRDPRRVGHAMRVLPDGRLRLEERAKRLPVGWRGVLPIGPDRLPAVAQALLVGVAVLGDDRGDPVRMPDGEPEPGRRAVVEHIDGVAVEADDLGEAVDRVRDPVERGALIRHIGVAEARQVGGDDMDAVGEQRDEVAEHVAGGREAMQQQQLRRPGAPASR